MSYAPTLNELSTLTGYSVPTLLTLCDYARFTVRDGRVSSRHWQESLRSSELWTALSGGFRINGGTLPEDAE